MSEDGAIGSDKLAKIIDKHPEINLEWLVAGQGSMLREPPAEKAEPKATPTIASNKKNKGSGNASIQENTHVIDKLLQEIKGLHNEVKELSSQNAVLEFINMQLTEKEKEKAQTIIELHENIRTLKQEVEALEKREKSSYSTGSQLPAEKTVLDLPIPSSMIAAESPVEYKRQHK